MRRCFEPAGWPMPSRLRQAMLLRAIVRRSLSDWPLVLAAWLLIACSTSLITAAATYTESVAAGGFQRMLELSPPASSAVRVHASVPAGSVADADGAVAPVISATLGADTGRTSLIATTDGLSLAGVGASDAAHLILVGSYADLETTPHSRRAAGLSREPRQWRRPCPSGRRPPWASRWATG